MAGGCVPIPDQWSNVHKQPYSFLCRKNLKQFISCAQYFCNTKGCPIQC